MADRSRRLTLVFLLAAALLPYFIGLGDSAIWDANEAFYVETPREMIEAGDYISPTFNYEPRLNKPVLSYWLVAGLYSVFGVSVAVQRFAIALGAVGLVAIAFGLAWLAAGERPRRAPPIELALWAAIGLAITPRLVMFARRILIDIYISLFMALTLLCFAAAERYPARRRLLLTGMYVSVGLGMLTKGPVAVVVPALVIGAYLIAHRELRRIGEMMIPAGLLVVLAIVVPWYAALYQRHGWTYIISFFVGENLDRFTSGVGVNVVRPLWWYLPVVLSDSFPWSLYLIPAAVLWFRSRGAAAGGSEMRIRTLLWLWIVVIVGFFSLSAGKQDLYIFPIVPAIAALAASVLSTQARPGAGGKESGGAVAWATGLIGSILLTLGAALVYLFRATGSAYAIDGVALVGAIGTALGPLVVWLAARGRIFAGAVIVAVAFIAINTVFVLRTLPSFEAYKPVPKFADVISRRAGRGDVVATYNQAMPSLVFYLRRHVAELFDAESLRATLSSGTGVYAVMSSDDYQRTQALVPAPLCVLDRQRTFDVKLRSVLAREPLPELVLVTNRCEAPVR